MITHYYYNNRLSPHRIRGFLLFITLLLSLSAFPSASVEAAPAARYIFFFIGDGMGTQQRNAAELYLAGAPESGKHNKAGTSHLVMNTLPVQGTMTTQSLSGITDSAAAGTALATGKKTTNGRIGMDASGQKNLLSIAKIAKKNGMKVGIITSSFLQDATPAAFYANAPSRRDTRSIGEQLANSGFDYFSGGFRASKEENKSGKNVLGQAAAAGFTLVKQDSDWSYVYPGQRVLAIPARLSGGGMPYEIDRKEKEMSLSDYVRRGIQLLNNRDGFFMMVEGGKIDLACHANDLATSIRETIAFDQSVQEALAFYKKHPEETLIIVTGDHETGGLELNAQATDALKFHNLLSRQNKSYLAAEGRVGRMKTATEELFFGLNQTPGDPLSLSKEELREVSRVWELRRQKGVKGYATYDPLTVTELRLRDKRLGVSWSTFYHSGKPVPVSALGVKQGLFAGNIDNTDVFRIISGVIGGSLQ